MLSSSSSEGTPLSVEYSSYTSSSFWALCFLASLLLSDGFSRTLDAAFRRGHSSRFLGTRIISLREPSNFSNYSYWVNCGVFLPVPSTETSRSYLFVTLFAYLLRRLVLLLLSSWDNLLSGPTDLLLALNGEESLSCEKKDCVLMSCGWNFVSSPYSTLLRHWYCWSMRFLFSAGVLILSYLPLFSS